jgi:hypothetical protein
LGMATALRNLAIVIPQSGASALSIAEVASD